MNKTYLYVLPLALIMGAYSVQSIAQPTDCEEAPPITDRDCQGVSNAPAIHINLINMNVTPRCAVAIKGTTIVISLTPRNHLELGTVEVFPKKPSDFWLRGKNDKIPHLIFIEVPGVHDPDGPDIPPTLHDFGIRSPERCLDPRIKVEH